MKAIELKTSRNTIIPFIVTRDPKVKAKYLVEVPIQSHHWIDCLPELRNIFAIDVEQRVANSTAQHSNMKSLNLVTDCQIGLPGLD